MYDMHVLLHEGKEKQTYFLYYNSNQINSSFNIQNWYAKKNRCVYYATYNVTNSKYSFN